MKFLAFMAMAIYTFLCVQAAQKGKDHLNGTDVDAAVDKRLESKLLHEVEEQGVDEAFEDETIGEDASTVAEFITAKDANQLNKSALQRSPRSLKAFPNRNVKRSDNSLDIRDGKDNDYANEARAIRRRQRLRRRNTKNKPKRINRKRHVDNWRKATRHTMKNHQRKAKTSNPKIKKQGTRRSLAKRVARRSQNSRQQKTDNVKSKRFAQRNPDQPTIRRIEIEQIRGNSGKEILDTFSGQ